MGKKFMGLGGTDHFWDRAKAWILNQITSAVTAKIAEVVANAPEDLDTLKEIADWISAHANDAAAMNTQITENKNNIAALQTSVAGKADKVHTHSTGDITSGTLPIANGGTGATTAKDAFMNLANGLSEGVDPRDTECMIYKNTDGTNWGLYTLSNFLEYIKGKISSVLGLTKDNYGGKASTAGTADVLANGSGKLKFFYTYSDKSKRLLKLGTFTNGTVASFLLTVKRTDGLGFTGYLSINSNASYSTNIKQFNGYKSSYSIYEIKNGELVFLYRNDDNTNDVYIWCPSYGVVSIILMCGENPWSGGNDTAVTLTEVSDFSGTLLDKF